MHGTGRDLLRSDGTGRDAVFRPVDTSKWNPTERRNCGNLISHVQVVRGNIVTFCPKFHLFLLL